VCFWCLVFPLAQLSFLALVKNEIIKMASFSFVTELRVLKLACFVNDNGN